MKYTCIDSFSGAGGLALGLINSGFEILLSFDTDDKCIETYHKNPKYFGHNAIKADIKEMLGGRALEICGLKRGELFLLAGGPPCQGFSVQRIGEDTDSRNELVLHYAELIKETYPYYFLMENVSGIQGKRGKAILSELIANTSALGYYVYVQCLDAQDYGVPQRRKRIIVVGERKDIGKGNFSFPTPSKERVTVREAIGHMPPPPEDGSEHPNFTHHKRDKLTNLNKRRLEALKPGEGRDHLPKELLADCHKIDSSIIGHRNVYGRMRWDTVAPTITARFDSFTRGLFGHPEQTRSISLREGAMLQTFPDDFVFSGNKVDVARQIGNAVPPVLSGQLGRHIIEYYNNCNSR